MINFVKEDNHNNLVLFIHGFTGGKDTWRNSSNEYFFDILACEDIVEKNCDIAYFEYFSKLTDFYATTKSNLGYLKSLFSKNINKSKQNNSVE
ncbi:MAG: hypothetical protein KKD73_14645, partial [Proteobacteria bacterium]|nr:hypothetical protein [Pseudomonadota bacterium]